MPVRSLPDSAAGSPSTFQPFSRVRALHAGDRWWLALALIVFVVLWCAPLESRQLVKPDEGRYAEIAREMAQSGDWITPRLNAIKYFEKPPLQYWVTAAAYEVFGVHNWTARLWAALTGLLGILATGLAARRLFGARSGWLAALTLSGCIYYVALGHINSLDMGLTLFMSVSVFGFLLAQRSSHPAAGRWMMMAWAAAGLGVLSKGLVAPALPALSLLFYSLICRDWSPWKRLYPVRGLLLFAALTAPWFIAVSLANPEFPAFFFIHEHFTRFLTKAHHRVKPWWFFIPILLAGLLPWTTLMFGAVRSAWTSAGGRGQFSAERFLVIHCAVVFGFFSLSGSKLPSYILPMFPPLALLAGNYLARLRPSALRWHALPLILVGIAMIAVTPFAIQAFRPADGSAELLVRFGNWIGLAGLLGAAAGGLAWWLATRQRSTAAAAALAAGGLLLAQTVMVGHDSLNPLTSTHALARSIAPQLRPEAPFFSVNMYDQTLPFYLQRTLTLVNYEDELEFGLMHEPERMLSLETFEARWRELPQAYALMGPDTFEALSRQQLPMREIARDLRRVIVARR